MAGREPRRLTLTFADDELDAVIAGLVMLDRLADEDGALADCAGAALARIVAVLPDDRTKGPVPKSRKGDGPHHGAIRSAIQAETKLTLAYVDRKDKASARTIWPIDLGFIGAGETIGAWCESRQGFRHFRLDRIRSLEDTGERYPERRRVLAARLRLVESEEWF